MVPARRPLPAVTLAALGALWLPVPPSLAGSDMQRCIVDGEVWYTDGPCPDQVPGQPVAVEPRSLGNLEDARRITQEADKLWLYKRQGSDGKPQAKRPTEQVAPPPRPHSTDLLNAIRNRQILDGMTPEEVEQAWGPPNSTRRGSDERMSWTYRGKTRDGRRRTRTVKFFQGYVVGWSGTDERARERFDQNAGRWLE